MTDIHTHVLHGIDDGAPDIETSRIMLAAMYDAGTRTAVCTPHFDYTNISPEIFLKKRDMRASELKEAAERFNASPIPWVSIAKLFATSLNMSIILSESFASN